MTVQKSCASARAFEVVGQAVVQFHHELCFGRRIPRFLARVATTTETSTSEQIMTVLSVEVLPTANALAATAGARPALTTGFSPGWSVMNSANGGLAL